MMLVVVVVVRRIQASLAAHSKMQSAAGDTGFQVKMLCHSLKQPVPCSHMHMTLSHLRHRSRSNIHFIKDMDLTN